MRGRYFNGLKTVLLLGLLTALALVVGELLGGRTGLIVALAASVAMNAGVYFRSDKRVLRTIRARPVRPEEAPALHAMVRELAEAAGQPMPRLYLSPFPQPNACATGRNPKHAAVVITEGIVRLLTPQELRAALAHELSHVYNRDILISSIAAALAGMITAIANLALVVPLGDDDSPNPLATLLMIILGPIAAALIRFAISRSREYQADADGARLSQNPMALASALRKVEHAFRGTPLAADTPYASLAHLMITNPLANHGLAALFHTHPPTTNRVHRLHQMARRGQSRNASDPLWRQSRGSVV